LNWGNSSIRVEEPYRRKDIVQCQRCQNYGHTRSYCNHIMYDDRYK
jgi:hypothetical protein